MILMIYCKEINEYIDYYEKNKSVFNKERILLIENIVKPTLERTDIFFDSETYDKCIRYCEKWYYKLYPYQKFVYAFVFMYKDDIPVFRTIIVVMGRGNGKDGMMAPLMNFLQSQYYGVKNYNIDIVATSEEQSEDTFKVVYDMMEDKRNKNKFKKYFYWNKEEVINKITKSRLKYNTSNAKTKDGKKDGAILFNEYHAYENDKQIKVFQSGLGKIRHPRIFIITTNGDVREGPLDELLDVCEGVLHGESNELRYLPFICKMDSEDEVDRPELWEKANPSLPYSAILKDTIMLDYLEMQKFPSKKPEFMTKRMNLPKVKEDQRVTTWDNILKASFVDIKKKIERPLPDVTGKWAVVGIDFADLNDFASAGFLFKVNGEYVWKSKTWICSKSKFFKDIKFPFDRIGQDGFQDFEIVETETLNEDSLVDWILEESEKNGIVIKKIIMDTYRFKLIKKTFEKKSISIESKDNPNGLVRMIRSLSAVETITAPRIEKEFIEGNINIGNSSIMRWSTWNTCVKIDGKGNKVYEKIEPKLRKNDTFMAFFCAMSGEELLEEKVLYAYY